MHIIFGKGHVSGASACCPGDVSSDEASGEDVQEVPKPAENAEKSGNQGKKKRKAVEDKDEKSPFFRMYKNTCLKIETAAERISTSVSIICSSNQSCSFHCRDNEDGDRRNISNVHSQLPNSST
jgi:hypothetical protein